MDLPEFERRIGYTLQRRDLLTRALHKSYSHEARLIEQSFSDDISAIDRQDLLFHDYKTGLQELALGQGLPLPDCTVVDQVAPGEGSSKKQADHQAAKQGVRESSLTLFVYASAAQKKAA